MDKRERRKTILARLRHRGSCVRIARPSREKQQEIFPRRNPASESCPTERALTEALKISALERRDSGDNSQVCRAEGKQSEQSLFADEIVYRHTAWINGLSNPVTNASTDAPTDKIRKWTKAVREWIRRNNSESPQNNNADLLKTTTRISSK